MRLWVSFDEKLRESKIKYHYGEEMENVNRALARMNMMLHDHDTAIIEQGNTLANPLFIIKKPGNLKSLIMLLQILHFLIRHGETVWI